MTTRPKIFEELGLRAVVNGRGPQTMSGASAMPPEVAEAMADVADAYVLVEELAARVGQRIAEVTGAEAGLATSGAAAAIVAGIAGCMTGANLAKVHQLSDTAGLRGEVIVQAGHMISYARLVRIPGARIRVAGSVYPVAPEEIEDLIGPETAAVFHIVSHHCQQKGMVPLERVIAIAHARGVPVMVDAAPELDLRRYIALGADLVAYSGGKAVPGPSASGILAGRRDLIAAAALQADGVCRPMKIGKETLVALHAALRVHAGWDHRARSGEWLRKAERLVERLSGLRDVEVRIRRDWTFQLDADGRPLPRVELWLDEPALGLRATDVARRLRGGDPAILLRDYFADTGVLHVDVTCLGDEDLEVLAGALRRELAPRRPG
jgi:L-seryl-tRNA(Ser) seleniumtransferase/D-glucosaminate-6-phosphate ammonia-lyase